MHLVLPWLSAAGPGPGGRLGPYLHGGGGARRLVCRKAGQRTRLVFRMLVHHGRKGEKKGFREEDFASLLDSAHQQLGGNIVLVWPHLQPPRRRRHTRTDREGPWLTVFRFPRRLSVGQGRFR